jgi:hypothetical protein
MSKGKNTNISSVDLAKRKGFHAWWHRVDNKYIKPCFIRKEALIEQRKYQNLLKIEQNKISVNTPMRHSNKDLELNESVAKNTTN